MQVKQKTDGQTSCWVEVWPGLAQSHWTEQCTIAQVSSVTSKLM